MENDIDVESMISKEILDSLAQKLLYVYGLTEDSTSTQYDNNYTLATNLYGKSLPAIKEYATEHKSVEDLSGSGRAILKLVDSPLYFRFIRSSPSEYRRKKNNKDILDLFNLSDNYSNNLDLFADTNLENPLLGFFFFETDSESSGETYVRMQIFDESWSMKGEWSSDKVQNNVTFTSDSIDEKSKEIPKAKLLESGSDILKPVTAVDSSTDSAANE